MYTSSCANVCDFSAILRGPQNGRFAIFSNVLDYDTMPLMTD